MSCKGIKGKQKRHLGSEGKCNSLENNIKYGLIMCSQTQVCIGVSITLWGMGVLSVPVRRVY